MAPDLSVLVEHIDSIQERSATLREQLTEPGPMTPGDRVQAAGHVHVLGAALANLRGLVRRVERQAVEAAPHAHA